LEDAFHDVAEKIRVGEVLTTTDDDALQQAKDCLQELIEVYPARVATRTGARGG